MLYNCYSPVLRRATPAALSLLLLTTMQITQAAVTKPLPFRELARGAPLVLTDQGKAFLSEKIRANAFTVKVMNISWDLNRKKLVKPTIYETSHDGVRFILVHAKYYHRVVVEAERQ